MNKLKELLKQAQNKHMLDVAMNYVLEQIEKGNFKSLFDDEVIELFRDKLYHLIILQGEMVNKLYLTLYSFYLDAPFDARFEKLTKIAESSLFAKGVSDNENIMLLELAFLSKILSGKPEDGLSFYLQNLMLIDVHCLESQRSAEFILSFFKYAEIPFERFAKDLKIILQEKFSTLNIKQKRSVFNWQLHTFWNVSHFYNHRGWLDFYEIWRDIFYEELSLKTTESIDFALYLQFFIYHLCGNNFSTQTQWLKFNNEITQYASKYYAEFAKQNHLPAFSEKNTNKIVIAFLRDRLVENSPYKVEFSFLQALLQESSFREKYEIKMYVMSLVEKSDNDPRIIKSYQDLGIEIFDVGLLYNQAGYYNSHLAKALALRERIQQDGVEILISPNNGYGISDFLFATRSAKKQIFWSHGNFVYDSEFVDSRITHICGNRKKITHESFNFFGIPVRMDKRFYDPFVPQAAILPIRQQYPSDMVILGNIGRLVKIDSLEFLKAIIQILKAHPQTIFLACGVGNEEEIRKKIMSLDSDMISRFYFAGFVDPAIYGHIIDFWLDSFPMEQGESRIEFVSKSKPSLVMSKESQKDRKKRLKNFFYLHQDVFKRFLNQDCDIKALEEFFCEDESFVAFDLEDYILKAHQLIMMDKKILSEKIKLQNQVMELSNFLRQRDGVSYLMEFLQQL